METQQIHLNAPVQSFKRDFWTFWFGQTISNLGSSFTLFVWPLLVFKLTGSALNLALSSAVETLPWLLFGFVIGAYVDRHNRKRLMIMADVVNALIIAIIPLLVTLHLLAIWEIYAAGFIASTISIGSLVAQSAAIPSLVDREQLMAANGRMQASYSAARVLGPLLAGILVAFMSLPFLLLFDALSFLISAASLALIKTCFNTVQERKATNVRSDIIEGLRYIVGDPVLRNLILMGTLLNLISITIIAQVVVFAKQHLQASDPQVGFLFSAGSIGVIIFSLSADTLRKYCSFSTLTLATPMLFGLLIIALAVNPWYWVALPLWALSSGMLILFSINLMSLRQAIVPNQLQGRVASYTRVFAVGISPMGTILGGLLIVLTKQVALIYGIIGVLNFVIALAFSFTALGHAEQYLQQEGVEVTKALDTTK